MKILLIILFFTLQVNAQNISFPVDMLGYDAKPDSPMFGNVRTILTSSYRNGKLLGYIEVETYDSNQRRVEKIRHSADIETHSGKMVNLSDRRYYFYQGIGNKLNETRLFNKDGNFAAKSVFSYDIKENLQEQLIFPKSDKPADKVTYLYNEEKKEVVVTITYYEPRIVTDKIALQYNDKNQWTKRITYNKDGTVNDTVSFEYNKNGLLVKITKCCEYNYFYTYEYKFDKKGNWMERIESYSQKNEEEKWVQSESLRTYRVITYYGEETK